MTNVFFRTLVEDSRMGYAFHKIIRNGNDFPLDFEIVEANSLFMEIIGLKDKNILGKKISALFPSNNKNDHPYPVFYERVLTQSTEKECEYFAEKLDKWYRVQIIIPDPETFIALFIDISELKKARRKPSKKKNIPGICLIRTPDASHMNRLSEERFRLLFETMAQGVVFHSDDGKIISANPAAERILGLTLDQMQGKTSLDPAWKCLHNDGTEWPGEEHPAMLALRTGKPVGPLTMGIFQPQMNDYVWVIVNATPLFRDGESTPYQVYATIQDITESRSAGQKYRMLFTEMVDAFALHEIICDDQGNPIDYRFLAVNASFEKMTGLLAIHILGKTAREVLPGIEFFWIETYGRVALTGEPAKFEQYSVALDKTFAVSAYQPAPNQFACTFKDISAQKQAEEQLRQSEEKFELLFKEAPLGYQSLDAEGCFIDINQAWQDTFGYVREDVIGKWFGDFLTSEYVEAFQTCFEKFKATGSVKVEFKMIHQSGAELLISFDGRISYDEHGNFRQTHCILQDVTEIRRVEAELAYSHELMRYVIEHSRSSVAIFDKEMNYLYVSQKHLEDSHFAGKDIIGKNHYLVFPNIPQKFKDAHKKALSGEIIQSEDDFITLEDGSVEWTRWECRPWYEAVGSVGGMILYSEIITKQKKAEENLQYQNNHDFLTGLYNRRFFEEELLRLDTKRNYPLSLIMGDINGLKLINDSFGHAMGDELLKKTAEVLKKGCRADDIIARLGGDEFVIILPKTDIGMTETIVDRLSSMAAAEKVSLLDLSICFGYETKANEEDNIQEILTKAENHMYRHKLYMSSSTRSKTVDIVMKTLFEKSRREMAHSNRVSEICSEIAGKVPLDTSSVNQLRTAGLMHDIGKIGIDENILNKPEKLTEEEWLIMKSHPEIGWRILSSVEEFSELAQFILEHHERWDGKGYPKGLKSEDVSIEGRIIAIADSYDAMTSYRTYRKALSEEEAVAEIKRCAGTQFDPDLAKIFVEKVLGKKW